VTELPLFPVTTVGSFPRPPALLEAQRHLGRGRIARADFDRVADHVRSMAAAAADLRAAFPLSSADGRPE
jgi:5-methyltetrahydropteroyltriglutamate--homocysteine methyltransferase